MATLAMKDFKKQYGIDLLPYATANTQLGDVMDFKGLLNKQLIYLDYNIIDIFTISDVQKEALRQHLAALAPVAANFPDIDATHSFDENGGIKIPFINLDLSDKVDKNKVQKFTFTNVTAKQLTGDIRQQISGYLVQLKQADSKTYREKIANAYLIEALFYANDVTISLTDNAQLNLNASTDFGSLKGINISPDVTSNGTSNYTISGAGQCPFAAQLLKAAEL